MTAIEGATQLTNNEDVIDSREVIARIEYLTSLRDESDEAGSTMSGLDDWERAELVALQALADQAGVYAADWQYGETLIRDSYFQEYAKAMAEDIGAVDPNASWPLDCIDWEQAAAVLQMDYTAVEFDGVTYWVR